MAVNLKTYCENCIHEKVCKNNGSAETFSNRLSKLEYGDGPNDDYDWSLMSDHYHVNIDISCADFEQQVSIRRRLQ